MAFRTNLLYYRNPTVSSLKINRISTLITMGKKFRKLALAFVDSIPDHKLIGGFPTKPNTLIHKGENFRLDMQSVSTCPTGSQYHFELIPTHS